MKTKCLRVFILDAHADKGRNALRLTMPDRLLRLKNKQEDARHHQDGEAGGNGGFSPHLQSGFTAIDLTTDGHR
jgi:hypothetical protein